MSLVLEDSSDQDQHPDNRTMEGAGEDSPTDDDADTQPAIFGIAHRIISLVSVLVNRKESGPGFVVMGRHVV